MKQGFCGSFLYEMGVKPVHMIRKPNDSPARAIEKMEDIAHLRSILENRPRDLLLFEMAIETGAPVVHLLHLKVSDLRDLTPGRALEIPSPGSGPGSVFIWTEALQGIFDLYMDRIGPDKGDYLFRSRKGNNPLTVQSTSRLVKGWFEKAGLSGLSGILSLHQTWKRHFHSSGHGTPENAPVQGEAHPYDIKAINVPSIQDAVYSELLRAIVSARIKPGEKIVAEKIARQMNVSRIPVREALGRLEAKGLVYTMQNRGTFASELSMAAMEELLEVRLLNEKMASAAAALRCGKTALGRLDAIHEKYVETWNGNNREGRLFDLNREFHFTIYREAGMPILMDVISMLWDRFSPYLYVFMDQKDVLSEQQDIGFHEGMIRGMRNSDPHEVCRWLETDIEDSKRLLAIYFQMHQDYRAL